MVGWVGASVGAPEGCRADRHSTAPGLARMAVRCPRARSEILARNRPGGLGNAEPARGNTEREPRQDEHECGGDQHAVRAQRTGHDPQHVEHRAQDVARPLEGPLRTALTDDRPGRQGHGPAGTLAHATSDGLRRPAEPDPREPGVHDDLGERPGHDRRRRGRRRGSCRSATPEPPRPRGPASRPRRRRRSRTPGPGSVRGRPSPGARRSGVCRTRRASPRPRRRTRSGP